LIEGVAFSMDSVFTIASSLSLSTPGILDQGGHEVL